MERIIPGTQIFEKKSGWSTVKMPTSVREKVKDIAVRENKPMWQVVLDGIECYEREKGKNWARRTTNDLDKTSYYILKLVTAVDRVKLAPNSDNLVKLEMVANQIRSRLGVDVGHLVTLARKLIRNKDDIEAKKKLIVEINKATKMAIAEIITKCVIENTED